LIEIFVNILRSQATTPLLPCVILKHGDSQWTKF